MSETMAQTARRNWDRLYYLTRAGALAGGTGGFALGAAAATAATASGMPGFLMVVGGSLAGAFGGSRLAHAVAEATFLRSASRSMDAPEETSARQDASDMEAEASRNRPSRSAMLRRSAAPDAGLSATVERHAPRDGHADTLFDRIREAKSSNENDLKR